jgi:hypothetical protein
MRETVRPSTSQPHGFARRMVAVLCAVVVFFALAGAAFAEPPGLILSDENLRAYDSMSVAEIQAFLDQRTGSLGTLVTSDYDKVITLSTRTNNLNTTPDIGEAPKPASQIIWEACQSWKINPKVMLTMLEKEQSLLSKKPVAGSTTLARAVGAGCPGSLVDPTRNPIATNKYPGFGNQIWNGARLLDGYGQNPSWSMALYKPGIYVYDIYRKPNVKVYTASLATYKLYIYNPSISGNTNFWNIYVKYFGDPVGDPPIRPVYRFYNKKNGSHFYTASSLERYTVATTRSATYGFEGIAYTVDTSNTASVAPLYRFYNAKKGSHFYTSSATERDDVKARLSSVLKYEGVAYNVSSAPAEGATTVYRFFNRKNGTHFYTASVTERDSVRDKLGGRYTYEGVAFYVMP